MRTAKNLGFASRPTIRALLASALGTAIAASAATGQAERFELTGNDIAVYNLVGDVTVEPGRGTAVVVEIRRGGPDARQLRIERGPVRGRETLRIIYPSDEIVYRELNRQTRLTTRVRDDGTFGDDERRRGGWRDGRRVEVSGSGSGLEAHANLTIRVPVDQQFSLYLGAGTASVANVSGRLRIDAATAPVTTTGTRGDLIIDVGSGAVSVSDAEANVDVDTGSGNVEVSGVRGDVLRVDTGSGRVRGSRIAVATLDIDTGSGGIDMTHATAEAVRLDTGSGTITLQLASAPRSIAIDTGSGDVTLTVPESFGARVEVETGSGEIDFDFPVTVRRWERDHIVGTIGDGSGQLVIDTGSGSVRIRKAT